MANIGIACMVVIQRYSMSASDNSSEGRIRANTQTGIISSHGVMLYPDELLVDNAEFFDTTMTCDCHT